MPPKRDDREGCGPDDESRAKGSVDVAIWGYGPNGAVRIFSLKNAIGSELVVAEYGATITELHLPDRNGRFDDVVLGLDDLASYRGDHPYFGGVIGRVANRVASGKVTISGVDCQLTTNEGKHHLHGGHTGFDRHFWRGQVETSSAGPSVSFHRTSPSGEEGYPGTVQVVVAYTLTDANALEVSMIATTDRTTVINLTQHTYWNLAGHASGDVRHHRLQVDADARTIVDSELLPTGELAALDDTAFDFRALRRIGTSTGYDVNLVLSSPSGSLRRVARLSDPKSGRWLELATDQPGLQVFVGGAHAAAKGGAVYGERQGLALEAQHAPDSPNHPDWPTIELMAKSVYRHRTRFQFGTDQEQRLRAASP